MEATQKLTNDGPFALNFYKENKDACFIYGLLIIAILQSAYFIVKKPLAKRGYVCTGTVCTIDVLPETLEEAGGSDSVPVSVLLSIRVLFAAYTLGIGIYQVFARGVFHFRFYTVWNWWMLSLYFVAASVASYRLLVREREKSKKTDDGDHHTEDSSRGLARACYAMFSITSVTVVIVDSVTWLVLVPMLTQDPKSSPETRAHFVELFYSFMSYNQHAYNAIFFVADFALNRQPFRFYALGYVGLWSALFAAWAQVVFAVTGHWLYPFLDVTKRWSTLSYTALYLVHWVVFAILWLIYNVKAKVVVALTERAAAGRKRAATKAAKTQ